MNQIIGYTVDKNGGVFCSDGKIQDSAPYLELLLAPVEEGIKVFRDLDEDVAQLLKLIELTDKELEILSNRHKLRIPPYELTYIPRKYFSIDKDRFTNNHVWAGFSDMSQYAVSEYKGLDGAKFAQHTGAEVYQAFVDLGFNPKQLISPANIYRKERMPMLDLPRFEHIPQQAMQVAYECCKGNWVEAFSIGHFDKTWDYDINSAYPYQASKLFDLRRGKWVRSSEYQRGAKYGYCRCDIEINSDFSPVIKQYDDRNYTPKGYFPDSINKAKMDFLTETGIGDYRIREGWWWFSDRVTVKPFEDEVNRLYALKESASGMRRDVIKRIMSGSFYGLFIEIRNGAFGDHFMSPYAAEIESGSHIQIASACLKNGVTPLHIAVDGVITDKPLDVPISRELGGWRMEYEEKKALICSSGLVTVESKEGKGDFSVSYDYLMGRIKDNPAATEYFMQKQDTLSLAQARNLHRLDDIGSLQGMNRSINFGDNKRDYGVMPANFGELASGQFRSSAWDNAMIEVIENVKNEEVLDVLE